MMNSPQKTTRRCCCFQLEPRVQRACDRHWVWLGLPEYRSRGYDTKTPLPCLTHTYIYMWFTSHAFLGMSGAALLLCGFYYDAIRWKLVPAVLYARLVDVEVATIPSLAWQCLLRWMR